jgi:type I restriction enzyme S subunit
MREKLPNCWESKLLPDICEIKTGKHDANHAVNNGKYRFYTCASEYMRCDTTAFNGESVIVPGNGDIGLVFFYKGSFDAYQRTYVLQNIEINAKFLYYHMAYQWRNRNSNKQFGSTVRYVRMSNFTSYEVSFPKLPEQNRIVERIEELFSELDKGVENLQTIKQQLKVYRHAVLKVAFELKPGWFQKKASDIGEINLGRQRTPKKISKDYPVKYIRAANITENGINTSDILEMEFTPTEQERYRLCKNDIILSEASGSPRQVGKPAIWNCEIVNCCFQNTVIRHRVKDELPKYIYWYYKYCYNCGLFSQMVGGVGINHLGAKNFSELVINVAPKQIQLQIVNDIETRLSVCDKIEQTVDETLQKAESLRQSILKKAFEGKLA